jgi:hypothetical protein
VIYIINPKRNQADLPDASQDKKLTPLSVEVSERKWPFSKLRDAELKVYETLDVSVTLSFFQFFQTCA